MGFKGTFDTTVDEVLKKHTNIDIVDFRVYDEPTEKDMFILKTGIEDIYEGDYYIYAEKIGPETARLFDTTRGWILVFMFTSSVHAYDIDEWLSEGLEEIRVKYELIGYNTGVTKDV